MKYIKLIISLIVIIGIYFCIKCYIYFSPATYYTTYNIKQHYDDTIRIAFIGDSWAMGHQYHKCILPQILTEKLKIPIKTESYGIGGLTSKEIYIALFEVEQFKMFMKKGYNYCIVSAGINDTHKKMSKLYYKNNMNCIIRFLIANRIYPIILEIPDYNIYQAYNNQELYMKIIQNFSMFVNSTNLNCKQQFRDALNELIKEKKYENAVNVIPFKSWNKDYLKDLETIYDINQIHLNERGYKLLDSVIAKEICDNYVYHKKLSFAQE